MHRRSIATHSWALGLSVLMGACNLAGSERSAEPSAEVASAAGALISDAVHADGTAGFYFLPPIVDNPDVQGAFVADADPFVSIDRLDGIGENVATFTMTSGPSGATITLDDPGNPQHFHVNWHTTDFDLDPNGLYRISVSAAGRIIGFADIDVVDQGNQLRQVDRDAYIPLLDGRTLPIKFRIGEPAAYAIGAGGGTVHSVDGGATLTIPQGALASNTIISIDPAETPTGLELVPGSVREFRPDGLTFASAAQLSLSYDEASMPAGLPESELTLVHGRDDGTWEGAEVASLDAVANVVGGEVGGFSRWGVGRRVTLVEVTPASVMLALAGETAQLSATASNSSGQPLQRRISFHSLDRDVVTVDDQGLVTAVAPGSTQVMVRSGFAFTLVPVTVSGAIDECPDDPDKTEPGACGCGVPDDDADGDGAADCVDECPADPSRTVRTAEDDLTCDGIDDDCNGAVDDGYAVTTTTCGIGACTATGSLTCVDGAEVDDCTPGPAATDDLTCDNVDNDCNGVVDDGFAGIATSRR